MPKTEHIRKYFVNGFSSMTRKSTYLVCGQVFNILIISKCSYSAPFKRIAIPQTSRTTLYQKMNYVTNNFIGDFERVKKRYFQNSIGWLLQKKFIVVNKKYVKPSEYGAVHLTKKCTLKFFYRTADVLFLVLSKILFTLTFFSSLQLWAPPFLRHECSWKTLHLALMFVLKEID